MKKNLHIIWILLLYICTACAPKSGDKLLSFFFDGVPVEDTITIQSDRISSLNDSLLSDSVLTEISTKPFIVYHEPYRKKECLSCHNKNAVGELLLKEPELCYSCHENFNDQYKYLHGPVGIGYCSTCHQPHMSESRNLLTSPGNSLCYPCHISYEIEQPSTHVKVGEAFCTECHNPHGENKLQHQRIKLTR